MRRRSAVALAVLVGGCTIASGVGDLSFDLEPPGFGGAGGASTSSTGSDGQGGGGHDGGGGMALPMTPLGDDFPVGATDPQNGSNFQPELSITSDGVFVVAWTDFGSPAPDGDFSAIRFDTFTAETCLTCFGILNISTTAGSQVAPPGAGVVGETASLHGWTSQGNGSSGAQLIFVGSDGTPIGGELNIADADWITLGAPWMGFSTAPSEVTVAWLAPDDFSQGIYTARVAPGGSLPSGILVNIDETGPQERPAIAVDASGRALIAWLDKGTRILARRIDPAGMPAGDEIEIHDADTAMCAPVVAASADRFVVVYGQGICDDDEFPTGGQIFAVSVDAEGRTGTPVAVSGNAAATAPDVAFDGEHFVVVWSQSLPGDGGRALQRRRLWQDGRTADPFPEVVHEVTANRAECVPSIAANASGRVAIAWAACDDGCSSGRAFPPGHCDLRMRYFE